MCRKWWNFLLRLKSFQGSDLVFDPRPSPTLHHIPKLSFCVLTFLIPCPQYAPLGPRWCFGSSCLTTNPNTCTTQWDYPGCSAVSHTWFSFNSKDSYLRIPLPKWLEYLGTLPETRQSQMYRLFTWPVCLRKKPAWAPLHHWLFTRYSGILLNSIMLTST